MDHTNNRFQKHWKETQDFIKKTWPKFSEVELKKIDGDYDRFFTYFNEIYDNFPLGESQARDKFQRFFNEMDEKHPDRE